MLNSLSPIAALGLGILAGVAALTPMVWLLLRRALEAETECARVEAVAVKAREILAGSPDGLFLWDHAGGGITCTRSMARLLTLADGTSSRFDAIVEKFDPHARPVLAEAVEKLRTGGRDFQLVLPLAGAGARNLIQAVGVRVRDGSDQKLADLVWMRDVSQAARLLVDLTGNTDLPEARDSHIRSLLDALPFPVWLRDETLKIAFTNQAALSKRVAGPNDGLAARARGEGRPLNEREELIEAGETAAYDVTESPVGENGAGGMIGYALPVETCGDPAEASSAAPRPESGAALEKQAQEETAAPARPNLAEAVLGNVAMAVAIFGENTRLDFFNRAYEELWGLDRDFLTSGPGYGEILESLRENRRLPEVPDFRAYKVEQLQLFEDVTDVTGDLMHLPNGRTLRLVCHPLPGGGLAFTYDDVTDQLDLERSINSLDQVQRATLDNLFEAIAVFGSDGRLKLSNPTFAQLWDIKPDRLTPRTHITDFVEAVRPLAGTEPDWARQRQKMLASMMRRELGRDRSRLTDGRVLEYANVPLPDGAVLLSYLDVTDDVALEDALRARAEAFQEASRVKSDFIANLSKELRTPLNAITGFADMLAGNYFGELNSQQQEYAENIMDTSRGLVEVVANILELAAIEADQIMLETEDIDVSNLIQELAVSFSPPAQAKDIKLSLRIAADAGGFKGDPRRLRQAISQLLDNAVTFTPHGGRINIAASRDADKLLIRVSDTGHGIRKDDRERLFQPFEKAPPPEGGETGPGLGLALVRSFIHLHGGTVEIESQPNKGTRVTCRLPLNPKNAPALENPPEGASAPPPKAPAEPAE